MNFIPLIHAAILGIVEGATEFIPVSSTGHLILVQNLLGFTGEKENAFIIFIQLGAILAVLWIYRSKIWNLLLNWRRAPEGRRLLLNLILGTLPTAVIGLPTEDWIESHFFKPLPVSLALILGGIAILIVERMSQKPSIDNMDIIPPKKAFGVGCVQLLAILFPGVSRAGVTIIGGMFFGFSRLAATEFSFFLAIPAMMGASSIKLFKARDVISAGDIPMFGVGFIVSFIAALVVIRGLLAFISRKSFAVFAWYRILAGAALLGYLLFF